MLANQLERLKKAPNLEELSYTINEFNIVNEKNIENDVNESENAPMTWARTLCV